MDELFGELRALMSSPDFWSNKEVSSDLTDLATRAKSLDKNRYNQEWVSYIIGLFRRNSNRQIQWFTCRSCSGTNATNFFSENQNHVFCIDCCNSLVAKNHFQCENESCSYYVALAPPANEIQCMNCEDFDIYIHSSYELREDDLYCNFCFKSGVATIEIGGCLYCLECLNTGETIEECEWCHTLQLGYGLSEHSFLEGCEWCEGQVGHQRDS